MADIDLSPAWKVLEELKGDLLTTEFLIRCVASGGIATLVYVVFGTIIHYNYYREVRRKVFDITNLDSDFMLALISLAFGSPLLQIFGVLHEKYGVSHMYFDIETYGWGYWAFSIPLYLFCWDFVFYFGHVMLHWDLIYRWSHFRHHAFRPPTAWSGISIDCIENFFSGLAPYLVPLFFFPFHVYTVYAINIALVAWALILHSSAHFQWPGFLGWLLVAPRDHNNHHNYGKLNTNFAALFTIWDRICGTLNRSSDPYWWASDVEYAAKQEQFAASNPTMGTLAKLARAWTNFAHGKVAVLAPVETPSPPGEKKASLRHRAQKKSSTSH